MRQKGVTCSRCASTIQAGQHYYSDAKDAAVCASCYMTSVKKCGDCGQPIPPTVAVYKTWEGKDYHMDCFRCKGCGKPVGNKEPPRVVDGVPYCSGCGAACARCGSAVKNQCLELDNKKYHKECYTCYRCNAPLEEQCFVVGNDLSCESCAQNSN